MIFRFLFLLVFLSLSGQTTIAQPDTLEILVLGTSHQNQDGDYSEVIAKLKGLQPDMVFGEYLSGQDLKALSQTNQNWVSYQPRYNFILGQRKKKPEKNLIKAINQAEKSLAKFPYYHQTRMALAQNYVLAYDRGNAEYQFWVLRNEMKARFEKAEIEKFKNSFISEDTLKALRLLRPDTEYHQIIFPVMYALGQAKIYAMDCQKYDEDWSQAWKRARLLIKEMETSAKADSTSKAAQVVKARSKFYAEAGQKIKQAAMPLYQLNNSALYGEIDAAYNFYGGERFYSYEAFPTDVVKEMHRYWVLRNQGMCRNVVEQARQQKAKRVLVAVGASHRKIMNDILSTYPNVKLLYYNDLK